MLSVHFLPDNVTVQASAGANLLQLALEAGVHINAACGGDGACGKCRVLIKSGTTESRECEKLPPDDYAQGWRLACRTTVLSDVVVQIPHETKLDMKSVREARVHAHETRYAVSAAANIALSEVSPPPVAKYALTLTPPSINENAADLTRVQRSLKKTFNLHAASIDHSALKALPHVVRSSNWQLTASVLGRRILSLEPGDSSAAQYAAAFDIGTTSLWGQLIDINGRSVLAEVSSYNPQIQFGDDVISRIVYSQKKDGLARLQQTVAAELNQLLAELLDKSGIEAATLSHITAAGNTVMTHLLLGIDPKYLREAPYVPAAVIVPQLQASAVGLAVPECVPLFLLPCVASYVGGDIVSGVVASGMYDSEKLTLYIDIGTNGEIVIGHRDWLMTASCSAGPAFEGGGLTCGMRAAPGAIEGFNIDEGTLEPMIVTVGRKRPRGICGSGAINILAAFMQAGIIARNGKFDRSFFPQRIREGAAGVEYILTPAELSATDADIVITESDIDNVIRAKAAMFAGYHALLEKAGLAFSDLQQVIIAGAFGDYIDLENAIAIGLFPDIPRDRYLFIGNGSLLGARCGALSDRCLQLAETVARKMTNIELSEDHSFMDKYISGLFLPHTDSALFPTVTERLARKGKSSS
ncbi:MAG: DUF4445 domain-containing protein [Deltaproteobacteria bacterium]|nr:DUF4445 domain-containing protein [Deltaproteobacteria bacterium]